MVQIDSFKGILNHKHKVGDAVLEDGSIVRDGDGLLEQVVLESKTITVARDGNNYIQSIDNGTQVVSYTRDSNNKIINWEVT